MPNQVFPYGKLKIIHIVGGNGVNPVTVRPDAGKAWQIIDLWTSHNDATARDAHWNYYDGSTTVWRHTLAALAAGVQYPFCVGEGVENSLHGWPMINRDVYLQIQLSGLDAGDAIIVDGLVLEFTYA